MSKWLSLITAEQFLPGEGALGILKEDYRFKRFLTRGKQNIETQFFLLAFAFNIEKLCNRAKKERKGQHLFCLEED